MKFVFLILTCLLLLSCGHTKIRRYANFDKNDKSISVPMGGDIGVMGDIKDYFFQKGYRVVAYSGGLRETYTKPNESVTRNEHNTRYKLTMATSPVELFCFGGAEVAYNISIVDTKTGQEVLAMNGADCSYKIFKKFKRALNLAD